MTLKTIHTNQGTFLVDEALESEFDPDSMLPEAEIQAPKAQDSVIVNGESFSGRLKTYSVTKNGVTGKTIIKVVLVG